MKDKKYSTNNKKGGQAESNVIRVLLLASQESWHTC